MQNNGNYLSISKILNESDDAIKVANRLRNAGYVDTKSRAKLIDDVNSMAFFGYTKTYMETCLAGLYGWDKVREWSTAVEKVFADEFNLESVGAK